MILLSSRSSEYVRQQPTEDKVHRRLIAALDDAAPHRAIVARSTQASLFVTCLRQSVKTLEIRERWKALYISQASHAAAKNLNDVEHSYAGGLQGGMLARAVEGTRSQVESDAVKAKGKGPEGHVKTTNVCMCRATSLRPIGLSIVYKGTDDWFRLMQGRRHQLPESPADLGSPRMVHNE